MLDSVWYNIMIRRSWSVAVPQITHNQSAIELDTVPPQFSDRTICTIVRFSGIAKWKTHDCDVFEESGFLIWAHADPASCH